MNNQKNTREDPRQFRPNKDGRNLRDSLVRTDDDRGYYFQMGDQELKYIEGTHSDGFSVYTPDHPNEDEPEIVFEPPFARRKASVYCHLWLEYFRRTGDPMPLFKPEMIKGDVKPPIPPVITAMGKPAIVAYMRTVQKIGRETTAEVLDVSPSTIRQYMYDITRRYRTLEPDSFYTSPSDRPAEGQR